MQWKERKIKGEVYRCSEGGDAVVGVAEEDEDR